MATDATPKRDAARSESVTGTATASVPARSYRIHTSDRMTWRKCRRLFVFGANVEGAMGMEPVAWNRHLWLGTGVHKALELWYRHAGFPRPVPATPEEYEASLGESSPPESPFVDTPAARFKEWREWWEGQPANRKMMLSWDDETMATYKEFSHLGNSMLTHYLTFAREADNDERYGFDIIETEVKFSVPIRDERGEPVSLMRPCDGSPPCGLGRPHHDSVPAVYEGRFDGIVRDRLGQYWILEHKTYKAYDERRMFNDDQSGSYLWAARRLYGYDFAGVLYNVLVKKAPVVPPVVYRGTKRERLSQDKNTLRMTTLPLFVRAIEENGHSAADYAHELDYLSEFGWSNFFKRTWVKRNPREIEEVGLRIYYETMEMSNPTTMMYPNPDGMRCPWCPFRIPCMMVSSGDDWKELIRDPDLFRRRESTDVDPLDAEWMPS